MNMNILSTIHSKYQGETLFCFVLQEENIRETNTIAKDKMRIE